MGCFFMQNALKNFHPLKVLAAANTEYYNTGQRNAFKKCAVISTQKFFVFINCYLFEFDWTVFELKVAVAGLTKAPLRILDAIRSKPPYWADHFKFKRTIIEDVR